MSTFPLTRSETPAPSPGCWLGRDLSQASWRVPIPAAVIDELGMAPHAPPGALPQSAESTATTRWLAQVREVLWHGHGIAVAGALPVHDWGAERSRRAVERLAAAFGVPVAQTHDGVRFYEVSDRGVTPAPGVRRSLTNVEQPFHTDGPWVRNTAELVSLYCLQAARDGGLSRCISLRRVVADLAAESPELAARLEADFLWHRQGEHGPGETPVSRLPMVWRDGRGEWAVRCYTDYVRSGHRAAGVALDAEGERALLRLDQLCADPRRMLEFKLRDGEVLWVNNRWCAHARSRFEPAASSPRPRCMLRVWHRMDGTGGALED